MIGRQKRSQHGVALSGVASGAFVA